MHVFVGKYVMVHNDAIVIGSSPTGGAVRAADAPDATPTTNKPMWSLEGYRRSVLPFAHLVRPTLTCSDVAGHNAMRATQQVIKPFRHRHGQWSIPSSCPSHGIRVDVTPHTTHGQQDDIAPQQVRMIRHR